MFFKLVKKLATASADRLGQEVFRIYLLIKKKLTKFALPRLKRSIFLHISEIFEDLGLDIFDF